MYTALCYKVSAIQLARPAFKRSGRRFGEAMQQTLTSDEIYSTVKEMVSKYRFRPGERINEIDLARTLRVSRTPLREALNRLLADGLVRREPNRGFISPVLDAKQTLSLYEYRLFLEVTGATLACERADADDLRRLADLLQRLEQDPDEAPAERLVDLDEAFHLALAEASHNPEFPRALSALNARIHFIRWLDMREGKRKVTDEEHRQILAAVADRDQGRVRSWMTRHISRRLDDIVRVIGLGYAEIFSRESIGLVQARKGGLPT